MKTRAFASCIAIGPAMRTRSSVSPAIRPACRRAPPRGLGSTEIFGVSAFETHSRVLTRNLSADGNRVFFETNEALLPADTNGDEGCPVVSGNQAAHLSRRL